jgi:hypothetical protein
MEAHGIETGAGTIPVLSQWPRTAMPIIDLYSYRLDASQRTDDVWIYDQIPQVLRVHISNVIEGALG